MLDSLCFYFIFIYIQRWWRHSGLGQIMNFCRDRLVENVLWNVGMVFEPQYGYCRNISTKIFLLLTVVDDTYDSYGTFDELEKFTNAFQRFDFHASNSYISQRDDLIFTQALILNMLRNSEGTCPIKIS